MDGRERSGSQRGSQQGVVPIDEAAQMTTPGAEPTGPKGVELSVISPVHNESKNIEPLLKRLVPVLERCVASFEIIFIDDGSTDDTLDRLRSAHRIDGRICALSLSRNFGKEIAITAGLDHVTGAATVIIDADLQHPPELIETFVARWREGYKNVFGQRIDRTLYSPLRRILTQRFYKLFGSVGETRLPQGAGDFRLLDAQAVAALRVMREHARFSKGLYAWIGFKSIGVPFDVAPRLYGGSKFSYRKLTLLALNGLMSFSIIPLRLWTYVGLATSAWALAMAAYYLIRTLIFGVDVPGFASLIVSIAFFAGVQLLSLGIIGEYIGGIFAEVKRRPLYLIEEQVGIGSSAEEDESSQSLRSG
jgi:polyisoprenyl-phosphate glycosyltransferase